MLQKNEKRRNMDLKMLSNADLLKNTELAALTEREATTNLLHHLNEVHRRRIFALKGCPSLFEYCVRILKMSAPQAGRRVNAAKLLRDLPQIESKINEGSLTLTTLSQAQVHFKREDKALPEKITSLEKLELLEILENKSTREVEKILVGHSSFPVELPKERLRAVTENFSEVRLVLDEETLKDLEKLKGIWSIDDGLAEVIKKMAAECLNKVDPIKKAERSLAKKMKIKAEPTTAPDEALQQKLNERSRYIPAALRHEVWLRDGGCCTYKDLNGNHCGSQHRLQIDHIHLRWAENIP